MQSPASKPHSPQSQKSSTASSLPSLTSAAKEARRRRQTQKSAAMVEAVRPFVPWTPHPKQAEFLARTEREALFGGAAGPGKSVALLFAALQHVHVPGYTALLLRRESTQLEKPKAILDLANTWLRGTAATWDAKRRAWCFPSGAVVEFSHLKDEADKYAYQGAAYHFVGFDELTQFTETQYQYLFSRTRRDEGSAIPTRVWSTSNPGGIGHQWVFDRFFTQQKPSRVFVPATLDDNPHLDRADYEQALDELDPVTRRQLRDGDWTVRAAGNFFKREAFAFLDAAPMLVRARVVRAWDLAATEKTGTNDPDWTVGLKMARLPTGRFVVLHVHRFRGSPGEVERQIAAIAAEDGPTVEQHLEQEGGSAGKIVRAHFATTVLEGVAVHFHRPTGDKVTRAKPYSAAVENELVSLVRAPWTTAYLDELTPFPSRGIHDDQVDASSLAHSVLASGNVGDIATELPEAPPRIGLAALGM